MKHKDISDDLIHSRLELFQAGDNKGTFINYGHRFSLYSRKDNFTRQCIKMFTFRVKLSDSIFFMLGLSPIVKLI